jgi:hypothetical protein
MVRLIIPFRQILQQDQSVLRGCFSDGAAEAILASQGMRIHRHQSQIFNASSTNAQLP